MAVRQFALTFGLLFLALGACGLFPPFLWPHPIRNFGPTPDPMAFRVVDGYLFGLFHVNAIHSGLHVLFGLFGLLACGWYGLSRFYAVVVTLAYAALTVLGLLPGFDTGFGCCPIGGYDVWLHFTLAGVAFAFGFLPKRFLCGDEAEADRRRRRAAAAPA